MTDASPEQRDPVDHDALTADVIPGESAGVGPAEGGGASSSVPVRIGPYEILEVIGEGGMGTVYRAAQKSPSRNVALKVIRPGLSHANTLRRFDIEAQILGRLDHPGIATIFEAGTFDGGAGVQPYFAMEFVEGRPLTDYASAHGLGLAERLDLLSGIADAVEHAHQKGVIHRDLKPSNILVTESGQIKILDFGVARATDSDLQGPTMQTDMGQLIGTVPYMSPEQAAGDPDDLDTRSDVYALGIVAYELLAGTLPYDVHKKMLHEAVRVIREDDPKPLSAVNRMYRGDVEIIVGKLLEKEKERRYQSAREFAQDLKRFRNNEPIIARPPSTLYQWRKFTKRNLPLVLGIASVLVVSVVGTVVSLNFAASETEQRELAEKREREADAARAAEERRAEQLAQVARFQARQLGAIDIDGMGLAVRDGLREKLGLLLQEQELGVAGIEAGLREYDALVRGADFTGLALSTLRAEVFEPAYAAIHHDFEDQPLVMAQLLEALAITTRGAGLFEFARMAQDEAFNIHRAELGAGHEKTLVSMNERSALLLALGELDAARESCMDSLARHRTVLGNDHPSTITAIGHVGTLLSMQGDRAAAEPYYVEALGASRAILGDDHVDTLGLLNDLGTLIRSLGRLDEARPYYEEVLRRTRATLGDDDPRTMTAIGNMGFLLQSLGDLEGSVPLMREALDRRRRVLGDDHPHTLLSMNNMGFVLDLMGRLDDARPYYESALEGRRRVLGPDHPDTIQSLNNMGFLYKLKGDFGLAEEYFKQGLESAQRVLGDDHPETLNLMGNLGSVYVDRGDLELAEPVLRDVLEGRTRVLGEGHPRTLQSLTSVGVLLRRLAKFEEAEEFHALAVSRSRASLPEGHWYVGVCVSAHARTLFAMGRVAEAEVEALEAHAILQRERGDADGNTIDVVRLLVEVYEALEAQSPGQGHDVSAEEWRARLPDDAA